MPEATWLHVFLCSQCRIVSCSPGSDRDRVAACVFLCSQCRIVPCSPRSARDRMAACVWKKSKKNRMRGTLMTYVRVRAAAHPVLFFIISCLRFASQPVRTVFCRLSARFSYSFGSEALSFSSGTASAVEGIPSPTRGFPLYFLPIRKMATAEATARRIPITMLTGMVVPVM